MWKEILKGFHYRLLRGVEDALLIQSNKEKVMKDKMVRERYVGEVELKMYSE